MIELLDQPFDDLALIELDVGLHRDVDLGANCTIKARKPRQTVEGMADRVEPGDRNRQRALLLGLGYDLVDPLPQSEVGAAKVSLDGRSAMPPSRGPPLS